MIRTAVVGAGGYSGAELVSILQGHPEAEISGLFASDRGGPPVTLQQSHARFRATPAGGMPLQPASADAIAACGTDVAFLATPHLVSHDLAPALLERSIKVFDLSASFRFADPAVFPRHYGFEHRRPDLLASAVYGLPELNGAAIARADLIGVPGCYPTSAVLPIAPLVRAGAIDPARRIIIDSISGVSGAGRSAQVPTLFCEVAVRPYEVLKHRHTPEIESHSGARVYFTPHLGPYDRGIVSTIHIDLAAGWNEQRLRAVYESAYAGRPFIRILPGDTWPGVAGVRATNYCDIGLAVDPSETGGHAIVVSAIDNLVKGAAGQAVQCMNIRFALPETLGLLPETRSVTA